MACAAPISVKSTSSLLHAHPAPWATTGNRERTSGTASTALFRQPRKHQKRKPVRQADRDRRLGLLCPPWRRAESSPARSERGRGGNSAMACVPWAEDRRADDVFQSRPAADRRRDALAETIGATGEKLMRMSMAEQARRRRGEAQPVVGHVPHRRDRDEVRPSGERLRGSTGLDPTTIGRAGSSSAGARKHPADVVLVGRDHAGKAEVGAVVVHRPPERLTRPFSTRNTFSASAP